MSDFAHAEALQALLDSASNALIVLDEGGQVRSANRALARVFEAPLSLLGASLPEVVDQLAPLTADPARFRRLVERFCDPEARLHESPLGTEYLREFTVPLLSDRRSIAVFAAPVIGEAGRKFGTIWSFADVTEMLRMEEQLRTLADASPIPLVVTRRSDGEILYANEPLERLLGRTSSEPTPLRLADLATPAQLEQINADLSRNGEVRDLELYLPATQQRPERWGVLRVVPTQLAGEPVLVGGLHDITDRRRAEEELRVSEARFRSFVENASDVVFACDLDARITYVSPNIAVHLGMDAATVIGRSFVDMLAPEDREPFMREKLAAGTRPEGGSEFEYRVLRHDGTSRWYAARIALLRDTSGNPTGITGIARDVHDRRLAQEALERKNRELEAAHAELGSAQARLLQSEKMASLGMLVAGIAHEINTPIGAVASMHDTLIRAVEKLDSVLTEAVPEASPAHPKVRRLLSFIADANRVIADGASRVTTIVKRLRSFARLDEAELKDANLEEGLDDTLTLIAHELKHGIAVERRYGGLPRIACYPGRMNQVFLNLLMNARQAIHGRGTITIHTFTEGSYACVAVSDTGAGIEPSLMSRIFDPGFTTKGVGVGTGLGLAICYQIVADHRGRIDVESEPGRGATFTIRIPLALGEAH